MAVVAYGNDVMRIYSDEKDLVEWGNLMMQEREECLVPCV